ncbi:DEAD/DEAH box helicase domain-containing protein [Ditylenchus destructor]|nr:DEAD/DEAH box helicase domain-containing protein [Ditylenchus destructor]
MENSEDNKLVFNQVHDLSEERTEDVVSDATFENLMIKPSIVETLLKHGYRKPSPVQAKAIPLGLLGMDMLVQAKTGTGKTLVFAVLCADHLLSATKRERVPHVMIVTPTREIAHQTYNVFRKICPPNFFYGLFVGGVDMEQDKTMLKKGCQVAIGTTGRLAHLVKIRALDPRKVSLFVLDEADKLMEESFKDEVNFLFSKLQPEATQVCVFSATYPRDLEQTLCQYMVDPTLIRLNSEDIQLVGIKQYAVVDEGHSDVETLVSLLCKVTYSQCLIFTNNHSRCNNVCNYLNEHEIRATHISSSLNQDERFKVLKDLKNFKIRVLVSSDLSARGIDATHVNIVINLECPHSAESYLHRIGRAGRFGTKGTAITILSSPKEHHRFKIFSAKGDLRVKTLDLRVPIPTDLILNRTFFESSKDFQTKQSDLNAEYKATIVVPYKPVQLPEITEPLLIPLRTGQNVTVYSRERMFEIREKLTEAQWAEYARQHPERFEVLHDVGNENKVEKKKKPAKGKLKETSWRNEGQLSKENVFDSDGISKSAHDTIVHDSHTAASSTTTELGPAEIKPMVSVVDQEDDHAALLSDVCPQGYFPFVEECRANFKDFMSNRSERTTEGPQIASRKSSTEYEQHIAEIELLQKSEEKLSSILKRFDKILISSSLHNPVITENC